MSIDPDMQEVITEFLVESHENLDALDRSLLELEQDPSNRATLSSIFRTIHTIKGTSGFLGFDHLEGLTHVAESLLSMLRDGVLTLTPASSAALFATVDAVRSMLRNIETAGSDGEDSYPDLVGELSRLQSGEPEADSAVAVTAPPLQEAEHVEATAAEAVGEREMAGGVPPAAPVDTVIPPGLLR